MEAQRSLPSTRRNSRREDQVPARSASFPRTGPDGFLGRHRMAAAITRLQSQINLLQEELDQLEKLGKSSIACERLVSSVESVPDPLLPLTKGPANSVWDRWFPGTQNSRRRWI
uniref:G protein gamma domain-containing protein n=1 Tax=Rhizophora mucronata TaxID=61149 RepID=A0A2P2Q977_RHIMU